MRDVQIPKYDSMLLTFALPLDCKLQSVFDLAEDGAPDLRRRHEMFCCARSTGKKKTGSIDICVYIWSQELVQDLGLHKPNTGPS